MGGNAIFVVSQFCSCFWAYVAVVSSGQARVVRWEDTRRRTNDGTDGFVSLLVLRPAHDLLKCRAVLSILRLLAWNAWMLRQVVVVVCGGLRHGTDKAVLVQVHGRVAWRENGGGRTDYGTDSGGHNEWALAAIFGVV